MLRLPQSLLARTTAVLALAALGIVTSAVLALYLLVVEPTLQRSADDEAALLVLSAQTWVELPPAARPYFELELAERHDLIISAEARALPQLEDPGTYLGLLEERLGARLGEPVRLRSGDELVWADVPMGGFLLQLGLAPDRHDIQPLYVALVIAATGAGIVFLTALAIVRRLARPLARAARAAKRFRGGSDITELPATGPRELQVLASSFNTMAREVSELISNRTTLLAGISHDLRTPLARMRLAVELLPDDVPQDLRTRLERNLADMERLLREALQLARGLSSGPAEATRLRDLVLAVVGDREVALDWDLPDAQQVKVPPDALARVLDNLVGNACRHGGGDVRLVLRSSADDLEVTVLDGGPGIPADQREQVFLPFHRLDSARRRETGGSGLGLAIVRQLCDGNGWQVAIRERTGGGARVDLCLPGVLVTPETPAPTPAGPAAVAVAAESGETH